MPEKITQGLLKEIARKLYKPLKERGSELIANNPLHVYISMIRDIAESSATFPETVTVEAYPIIYNAMIGIANTLKVDLTESE